MTFKRRSKILLVLILSLVFIYFVACLYLISSSRSNSAAAENAFYKKAPDLIVVFTGDNGRIPFALKKAQEYGEVNLFITGVYVKNTVKTLLQNQSYDFDKIDIDYHANNTVENVIATLRHLGEHPEIHKVLIISHDYHLLRIKLLLEKIEREKMNVNFHYMGIPADYQQWRNLKLVATEVFKLARAYAFVLLWDREVTINQ